MSGSEASDVPVKVSATLLSGSDSKVLDFQQNTNGIGQVSFSIHVPPTITELRLLVVLLCVDGLGDREGMRVVSWVPLAELGRRDDVSGSLVIGLHAFLARYLPVPSTQL